jgi:hypothetical protein
MSDEARFNISAAGEFIAEYQRETGQVLRFNRLGNPFPDLILETAEGRELGVELVSLVLPFINQEQGFFGRYRDRFLEAIQQDRPRFRNTRITLQLDHQHVEAKRPLRLPDPKSKEGAGVIADFRRLLIEQFEMISTNWGGKDGGAILDKLRSADGALRYPLLTNYFEAVIFHQLGAAELSGSMTDDPEIANPLPCYSETEILLAVRRALDTKASKGSSYSTDLLVIHTLPKIGVPENSGIGMDVVRLIALGKGFLASMPELGTRFREIWLLNRYITDGRRLYRL